MTPEDDNYYKEYIKHLREQIKQCDFVKQKMTEEIVFFMEELERVSKDYKKHKPFMNE